AGAVLQLGEGEAVAPGAFALGPQDNTKQDAPAGRLGPFSPEAASGPVRTEQEGLRRKLVEDPELRYAAGVNRDRLERGDQGHARNGFNAVLAAAESVRLGRTVPALPGGPVSVGEAEKRLGGELISAPLEEIERHLRRPEQPVGAQGVVFFDGQWLLVHKARDGGVCFVDGHRGQMADLRTGLGRDGQGSPVHGPSGFMPLPGTGALPLGNQRLDPTLRGGADDGAARPDPAVGVPDPAPVRPGLGGVAVVKGLEGFAEAFGMDLAAGAEYVAGGGAGLGVARRLLPEQRDASRREEELWKGVEGAVAARAAGEARRQVRALGLPGSLPGSLSGA
ncbi:hypothetical protein ACFXPA_49265, partial [Amycolatopsis sp. NPDC059090]|uniref:hypothetical protein n=1 Tax=Amycolatopsis sp. NPDC059090 TaxID=3346723 RepID=UPI00366DC079